MATERQKKFCIDMYHAAQRINEISPVFVAAQACLESGWGVRESGVNNFFGITRGSNWPFRTGTGHTDEYLSSVRLTRISMTRCTSEIAGIMPCGNGLIKPYNNFKNNMIMGTLNILSKSSNNIYSYVDSKDAKLTVNGNFEIDEQDKKVLSVSGNIIYDGTAIANFTTSMYDGVQQYQLYGVAV
jgi:hypothetical protein